MLKPLLIVLALALAALMVLVLLKKLGTLGAGSGDWPYVLRRPLSQPEQVLYHRLVKALPEHIVLAQVQVSRVLGVKKGANFQEWHNRINRLSYDFVVCAKDSTAIAAIELDDKSHENKARASTDDKKDKATAAAGLRMIRWHVKSLPDESSIKAAFAPAVLPSASIESALSGAGAAPQ